MKIPLEIKQLGEEIKQSLPDKSIKVIGEVSQPKNFRGNMYLNLKDNYCSIKSIIWKSRYEEFSSAIKDGDKIIVQGKLDFYGGNGTISFIIEKLIKHDGEGELFQLYQKYKKEFEVLGYFLDSNKYIIPDRIDKILLLTSEQGAAIQDFIYALDNNKSKLDYDIIDVPVQGHDCPKIIIEEIRKLKHTYDLIVITRGGGSFEDLFGFSKPELIEEVYKFNQPVLSAIGHQVDTSLLDLVADCCCPTPSLAAQYIIDTNKSYIRNLESDRNEIKEELIGYCSLLNKELNKCNERLNMIVLSYERIQQSYQNELLQQLNNYALRLKELDFKLNAMLNQKDNEIRIMSDGNNLNFDEFNQIFKIGGDFTINWNNTEFKISNYK